MNLRDVLQPLKGTSGTRLAGCVQPRPAQASTPQGYIWNVLPASWRAARSRASTPQGYIWNFKFDGERLPAACASTPQGYIWNSVVGGRDRARFRASTPQGYIWNRAIWRRSPGHESFNPSRVHLELPHCGLTRSATTLQPLKGTSGTWSASRPVQRPRDCFNPSRVHLERALSHDRPLRKMLQPLKGTSGTAAASAPSARRSRLQPLKGTSGTESSHQRSLAVSHTCFNPSRVHLERRLAQVTLDRQLASTPQGYIWNNVCVNCGERSHELQPLKGTSGTGIQDRLHRQGFVASTPQGYIWNTLDTRAESVSKTLLQPLKGTSGTG